MKTKFIVLIFCLMAILGQAVQSQGLTDEGVYNTFKYQLSPDPAIFSDSVIYQLINLSSSLVCELGFAYQKIDTIVIVTDSTQYGLEQLALWVYKVGKIGENKRSWQHVSIDDFGREQMDESFNVAYFDFTTELLDVDSMFSAGSDTSFLYIYPKPRADENGDSMLVHYFAYADTIDNNLRATYSYATAELALMFGYMRKQRSDIAVTHWNNAVSEMSVIRNLYLSRLMDIEVVRKNIGGD